MFKEGDKVWYFDRICNEIYREKVKSASEKVVRFSDDFVVDAKDCFSNKDEANLELVKRCLVIQRSGLNDYVRQMKRMVDNIKKLEKRKDKLERKLR